MQNICVITAAYPLNGTYDGIFVRDQCRMLIKQGFHVSVLVMAGRKPIVWPKHEMFETVYRQKDEDIDLFVNYSHRFASTYLIRLLKKSVYNSSRRLFYAYVKEFGKPDIIIAHFSFPAGIAALKLAQEETIPLITIEHLGLLMNDKARTRMTDSISNVMKGSDRFICVSDHLREAILRRTQSDMSIEVIPNIVADQFFDHRNRCSEKEGFLFLSVGNLILNKNMHLLIKAFTKAFRHRDGIRLRIAGTGPEYSHLAKMIKKYGMESQIQLLGRLDRTALLDEYVKCDCFVLLSKNESFGIVYREAMAVGRPIIAAPNNGILFGWEDQFGIITKTDKTDKAAQAMETMVQNISDYDHDYISQRAYVCYSMNAIGEKYRRIIMDVIASHCAECNTERKRYLK